MKVMYLGTAASEGYPAIFCDCDNCRKARELGGKNLRCRAQTLINHDLLIDWNSDTLSNTYKYGLDFSKLNYLLITHTHEDHFQPWEFSLLAKPFAIKRGSDEKFNIYGSADIEAPIAENTQNFAERYAVKVNVIKPFEPQKIGEYTVTALKANHGSDNPYNYIIEQGGKAMLYAHDTGFLLPETYEYIKNSGVRFDFVSLDCTSGNSPMDYNSHMNIERNIITRDSFLKNGIADENTVFAVNHFSHGGADTLYEDMKRVAGEAGFVASYDGMTVEF